MPRLAHAVAYFRRCEASADSSSAQMKHHPNALLRSHQVAYGIFVFLYIFFIPLFFSIVKALNAILYVEYFVSVVLSPQNATINSIYKTAKMQLVSIEWPMKR